MLSDAWAALAGRRVRRDGLDPVLARLETDAAGAWPLPRRRRGPEFASETPSRAALQPPERRRGPARLERLGGARLQRRNLRALRLSEAQGHRQKTRNPRRSPNS